MAAPNVRLSQPGGSGDVLDGGHIQTGARCYLSASGVTAASWAILSSPSGSASSAKLHSRLGWYFDPDVASYTPYVVRLTDSAAGTQDATFVASPDRSGTRALTTSGPIYAEWYGVVADGRKITDGVLAAGSNVLQSASAAFTQADVGRRVLLRTPQSPCPGTVALTSGNTTIVGTTTAFDVNIPAIAGIPSPGGAVYVDGEFFAILLVVSATNLSVRTAPTHSVGGVVLYRETQVETTIVSVADATRAVLGCAPATILASGTGVWATIASDDMAALDDAITDAFARGSPELILPKGVIGIFSNGTDSPNLYYAGKSGLTIRGQGRSTTVLTELRKASRETLLSARARNDYGLLTFENCSFITVTDLSVDGSVPVLGMAHTTGGLANNSGGRGGIFCLKSDDCSILRCGSVGYGARDEMFYADGRDSLQGSARWRVEDCDFPMTNNNAINAGNVGPGLVVRGNRITSAYFCLSIVARSGIVSDNIVSAASGFTIGSTGTTVINQVAGDSLIYANNLHLSSDTHGYSDALVVLFPGSGADATCTVVMRGNKYIANVGYFYALNSAVIRVQNMPGTVLIDGETFDRNTAAAAGGTFIEVDGASTGRVIVGPCEFRGRAGSNMTIGVLVDASVPGGKVSILPGSTFGESVTTKWSLAVACETAIDRLHQFEEIADPTAPASNQARLYARDNGAGKTQIVVRFPTGAVQVLATEP